MASEKAPVKLTGGGGFGFADRVGAYFLLDTLSGGFPLGAPRGSISQIDFETRDQGWLLDDLLLTLSHGRSTSHCAISIKSNEQVTQNGFPADFTSAIWEQARQTKPPVFVKDRDLLALGIARLPMTVKTAWESLLNQALETPPERLLERLEEDAGQTSETQRKIFASLHCPPSVCQEGPNRIETARLLRSLRILTWDFESEPSDAEARAVELCRSVLTRAETSSAISLWEDLQKIAADGRAVGASYNLPALLAKLRGKYDLKDHPDFRPDWDILRVFSDESRSAIKREVGRGIRLPREKVRKALDERRAIAPATALVGEPGSGKSAFVASIVEDSPATPVIWLDHTQFDHPNHVILAKALNLRHTIPELLSQSGSSSGLIVFDSLEKYSTRSRRLAGELIKAVADTPGGGWRVLITCQAHMWEYSLREFVAGGIQPKEIATHEITPPGVIEVIQAVSTIAPRLVPLLLRPELQNVLCNLKVLDWVVTEETLRSGLTSSSFVGETDVIQWVWDRWTGAAVDKHARAAVLIRLGEHDGSSLGAAVNILDLSDNERRTLGELERDDLLRARGGLASFKHDLLGDWARLQSLLAAGSDTLEKVRQVSPFPRWQRAVRLYAQSLLEHEDGVQRWRQALSAFQGTESTGVLAGDFFLDALIFSGNAEALLEQVWPVLIADEGQLLQRLLRRFLYIASIPDPRAEAVAEAEDLDWLSTRLRVPFVLYWYAPLRVLERHSADVCRFTLFLAAELCELWLRTIPQAWGGRTDAAKLAIQLAREVQGRRAEKVWFRDNADQKVFEALCHAAPDFPDEVSQLLLELCHRREQSPEITARENAYKEKRQAEIAEELRNTPVEVLERRRSLPPPIVGSWNRGQRRPPAVDGPRARVPESFRTAILNSSALLTLAHVRPAIAREVLLAVCIDEPKTEEHSEALIGRALGTTNWRGGYPAMYFRGPFLRFLESEPDEAVEAITRLVNYATERWAERFRRGAPPDLNPDHYSLELQLPAGTVRWTGNFHVFGWYREIMIGSNSVESALMALEKWLYNGIDSGRDMSAWLDKILARSNSVAFAGVLVAVGVRTPNVLAGSLRPLLGSWRLYDWHQHLVPQDDVWRIGMIAGWGRAGPRIYNQVVEWHTMPHRKVSLRDAVIQLLLFDEPTREFLNEQRKSWLAIPESQPNETLELLAARLDPANYSLSDLGDSRVQVDFQWPIHLRERTTQKAEAAQRGALALAFPHRCRQFLKGEAPAPEPDVFWSHFQGLVGWKDDSNTVQTAVTPEAIAAAGIAVVLTFHRSWLAAHPDRERWCIDELQRLAKEEHDHSDTPYSILDTSTESFLGEAAVVLMTEREANWARELAARGIMGFYYTSTRCVMRQAFRQRASLKEDFGRVVNLMVCWSGLRWAANHTSHSEQGVDPVLERAGNRLMRAFVTRSLPVSLIPPQRIAAITRRATLRIDARNPSPWARRFRAPNREGDDDREVDRNEYWLDTEVLSHGFGFLGSLAEISGSMDRPRVLEYHSAVLSLFLSTMPKLERPEQEVEGLPYEFDRWVLQVTAALIAELDSPEEARSFWQPILDLGSGAHHWVENFCSDWFLTGRQFAPSIDAFGTRWGEMILHTLEAPSWTGEMSRSYRLEGCSIHIMGLGLMFDIIAAEEFTPTIKKLAPLFERWADRWLSHARPASRFAYFLSRAAGRALLPSAITWLNRGVQAFSEYAWDERDLADSLAAALRSCWRHNRNNVAADSDLQNHFLQLLNTLCNLLNADALALRTEVSQFISGATA